MGFETYHIVLIESFRNATPVIALRSGPVVEIVSERGGVLLSRGADLRAAMARIAGDGSDRADLARAARAAFERLQ